MDTRVSPTRLATLLAAATLMAACGIQRPGAPTQPSTPSGGIPATPDTGSGRGPEAPPAPERVARPTSGGAGAIESAPHGEPAGVTAAAFRDAGRLVDSLMATPPLGRAHWGIAVYDAMTGERLLVRNEDELFIPASNMKLVTVAAALARLGPGYRFETPVSAWDLSGDSAAGLIIRGSGDPTFSAAFYDDAVAPFDSMADSLAAAGLRRVAGPILVDQSRFDSVLVHGAWETGDLLWYYAAPVAALAFMEAAFPLLVRPGAVGHRAHAYTPYAGAPVVLDAAVETAKGSAAWNDQLAWVPGTDTLRVRGSIGGASAVDRSMLAQNDPGLWAGLAFRSALERAGIRVAGPVLVRYTASAPAPAHTVTVWRSPALVDILPLPLARTDNWVTEMILKALGAEAGKGGTWRGGTAVAEQFMVEDVGVDPGALYMRDGSGLAAQNLITPRALATLLRYVRSAPWGSAFRAAMAMPGDTAGTLERRLPGFQGRVAAKTGTITHVNALSGYLTTDGGRELVFSILTNAAARPARDVRAAMDRVVEALLRNES